MNNPRRMRRHARRMRRYGMQPMVVINSGDPLPDLIIVTLARWLWRYRSELAPAHPGRDGCAGRVVPARRTPALVASTHRGHRRGRAPAQAWRAHGSAWPPALNAATP